MKAKIVKVYKGEPVVSIERSFSDAPSLFEFLQANGVTTEFKDVVHDFNYGADPVVYSVPLVAVEVDSAYN